MRFIGHLHSRTAMLWMLLVALILSACGALVQGVPGGAPIQATPGDAPTQEASMFRANSARTGVFPSDGPTTLSESVWTFKTDVGNAAFVSSLAIADGVVYVGSKDGRLYALDAETGQEKWSFKTGSPVPSSPAVAGGVVYFGDIEGYVYAVR